MTHQPDAPSAQPAIRPAARTRARLMPKALSALLALLAFVFLPQAVQAQGTEPPPGIRSGVAQSSGIKVTLPSVGGQVNWFRYL